MCHVGWLVVVVICVVWYRLCGSNMCCVVRVGGGRGVSRCVCLSCRIRCARHALKKRYLRSRDQKRDIRSFMKGCGVRRASAAAVFSRCEDMLRDAEGRSVRIRRMSIFGKSCAQRCECCGRALSVISYERPLRHYSYAFDRAQFRFSIFFSRGAPPRIPNIENFGNIQF